MVNNFVASAIYQKCFRGLRFDARSRKYSFDVSFSAEDASEIILRCDRAGHAVYEDEIGRFLDQTVCYTPVYDEWRRLPLDAVMPGECVSVRGQEAGGVKTEAELLKLTGGRWLTLLKDPLRQTPPLPLGIVDIPDSHELNDGDPLQLAGRAIVPDLIRIELPSPFHRAIDRVALNMEYVSRGPGNILRLYNELIDRHTRRRIDGDTEGTMDLVASYGVSTFVLRKLLDYMTLYDEY